MTDRERHQPDPGRDAALTIAARIFGDERHVPKRTCLGCGGAGSGRHAPAVSWQCDGSGPEINGDWSEAFRAWGDWQYAASMFQSGHRAEHPGPEPAKPSSAYDWSHTFTWSQIKERAEALAVGEQVGAFDAAAVAEPEPMTRPAALAPSPAANQPAAPTRGLQMTLTL